jgi:hypothetical protein
MFIDPKDKSLDQLTIEVSRLYRRLLHDAPSFHFRENYKGTPDSPRVVKGRHDYTVEVGLFKANDKGERIFTVLKSFTDTTIEKAFHKLVADINADW